MVNAQGDKARPNVLFVSVDQWPGGLMGVAGHPVIETPTLDQLAANGTYYPNAYSECPICLRCGFSPTRTFPERPAKCWRLPAMTLSG